MRWDPEEKKGSLEPGKTYPCEITGAEEALSKKGNEMIVLKLNVFDGQNAIQVTDWLVSTFPPKLNDFCRACGLKAGTLRAADCLGKKPFVIMDKKRNDRGYAQIGTYTTKLDQEFSEKVEEVTAEPELEDTPF